MSVVYSIRAHVLTNIVAVLMMSANASADQVLAEFENPNCYRIGKGSLFGFLDKNGAIVQLPKFEYCGRWMEGMLWVREKASDRMSGRFIDANGRSVTQNLYGDLFELYFELPDPEFYNGIAILSTENGQFAFINREGRILGLTTFPIVAGRQISNQNIFGVCIGDQFGFVDDLGNVKISARFQDVRPFRDGLAAAKLNGKWGLIGLDGEFRVHPKYDEVGCFIEEPNYWKFRIGNHWGVLDRRGDELVAALYLGILRCENGIASVVTENGFAIVELSGETDLKQREFEDIGGVGNGFVLAKVEGKWGGVSTSSDVKIPFRFDDVHEFDRNGLSRVFKGEFVGLLNRNGKLVCEPIYDNIMSGSDELLVVDHGGKWGIINTEGQVVVEPAFEFISGVGRFCDGMAIVKDREGWGLLEIASNRLVIPCIYADLMRWNDLFSGKKTGVYTLFSTTGEIVVCSEVGITDLPEAHKLVHGYGIVRGKSGAGIITRSGKLALPLEYEDVGLPSEGLIPVKKKGKWGFLDLAGAMAIPPQFNEARSFRNGVAAVEIGGKYGFIDATGELLVQPAYVDAGYSLHGLLPVARTTTTNGVDLIKWGLINHQGEVVVSLDYDCLEWGDLEENKTRIYGHICWEQR
jgi:hypothetical protein